MTGMNREEAEKAFMEADGWKRISEKIQKARQTVHCSNERHAWEPVLVTRNHIVNLCDLVIIKPYFCFDFDSYL